MLFENKIRENKQEFALEKESFDAKMKEKDA